MAIIIVGDIDVNIAEKKIIEHFVQLKNPDKERKVKDYEIPDNKEPNISLRVSREETRYSLQIYYKHNKENQTTIGEYKRFVLQNLYIRMLNRRLLEISQRSDAPFIYAYAMYGGFYSNNKESFDLIANAKENQMIQCLNTVLLETERVKKYGFTQNELNREKHNTLNFYETLVKELNKTETSSFIREYVSNFLTNEPIPGIENELKYVNAILPEIISSDFKKLSDDLIHDENVCMSISEPYRHEFKNTRKADIIYTTTFLPKDKLKPYIDKFTGINLIDEKPKGSKIISRKDNEQFGYTEVHFENGIKAVLMPTDFKNDQILFSAYSPGGSSLYPDSDFISADNTADIVGMSGISKFNKHELDNMLMGKIVKLTPYINNLGEGFHGNSSPEDFESLLQLLYLYFIEPRKDTAAFNTFLSQKKDQIKSYRTNTMKFYADTLVKIITNNSPRVNAFPTLKQIAKIKLDKVYNIFKERFSDASNFTFFVVGNFKTDSIINLLETYIGGLPVTNRKETWKDAEPKFPDGVKDITIYKGYGNAGVVSLIMKDKFEWNYTNVLKLKVLTDILQISLREKMRNEKREIYTIGVESSCINYPNPEYNVTFKWVCAPGNIDELTSVLFKEIKNISKNGPDNITLGKVKENLYQEREIDIKKNEFWIEGLEKLYFDGNQLYSIDEYKKMIEEITVDDIKKIANNYLTLKHYVRVVLKPETM